MQCISTSNYNNCGITSIEHNNCNKFFEFCSAFDTNPHQSPDRGHKMYTRTKPFVENPLRERIKTTKSRIGRKLHMVCNACIENMGKSLSRWQTIHFNRQIELQLTYPITLFGRATTTTTSTKLGYFMNNLSAISLDFMIFHRFACIVYKQNDETKLERARLRAIYKCNK